MQYLQKSCALDGTREMSMHSVGLLCYAHARSNIIVTVSVAAKMRVIER